MNVPFPPLWLLPFPILLLAAGVLSLRRWRAMRRSLQSLPAPTEVSETQRRAAAVLEALRVRGTALNTMILGTLALYELIFFTAPPVRGRVIELQTGKPIAGARVMRHLYQVGPWSITEGPTTTNALFSTIEVRSDSRAEFTLPGWINLLPLGVQGLSGMSWVVYEPGWMPAYNCERETFHPWGAGWISCGGFGPPGAPDPWVLTKVGRFIGFTTMQVRVSRPTLKGVTFGGIDSHGRFVPALRRLAGTRGRQAIDDRDHLAAAASWAWGRALRAASYHTPRIAPPAGGIGPHAERDCLVRLQAGVDAGVRLLQGSRVERWCARWFSSYSPRSLHQVEPRATLDSH